MKVTQHDVERRIKSTRYIHVPGTTTTVAHVTLDNGFSVVGTSAAIDPKLFDAEIGKGAAYGDAVRQIYPLMAFLLLEAKHQNKGVQTFGGAVKALKEGKRVARKSFNGASELYLKDGKLHVDFFGGHDAVASVDTANVLAEDWIVL